MKHKMNWQRQAKATDLYRFRLYQRRRGEHYSRRDDRLLKVADVVIKTRKKIRIIPYDEAKARLLARKKSRD